MERRAWCVTHGKAALALPGGEACPAPCPAGVSPAAGSLGLEEGQAAPEALLQELHVGGRGRVFKGGREAEDVILNVLGLHGRDVQEVVGVDVVDLGEDLGEESKAQCPLRPRLPRLGR